MATVADELLNDFEDSGSEGEEESKDIFQDDGLGDVPSANGLRADSMPQETDMELDGDEEPVDDDLAGDTAMNGKMEEQEDEEETKARVEKMQLGGVSDVRSVASLMKTLEPVLEVSRHTTPLASAVVYIQELALTPTACYRK